MKIVARVRKWPASWASGGKEGQRFFRKRIVPFVEERSVLRKESHRLTQSTEALTDSQQIARE